MTYETTNCGKVVVTPDLLAVFYRTQGGGLSFSGSFTKAITRRGVIEAEYKRKGGNERRPMAWEGDALMIAVGL